MYRTSVTASVADVLSAREVYVIRTHASCTSGLARYQVFHLYFRGYIRIVFVFE